MVQEKQRMLQGVVQVDETLVGGYSKGNVGRSLAEKSAVLIVVEDIGEGKTGNIRMKIIESLKAEIFDVAIDNMVENSSSIKTDNHKSYNKLKKKGKNIQTYNSDKGNLLQ